MSSTISPVSPTSVMSTAKAMKPSQVPKASALQKSEPQPNEQASRASSETAKPSASDPNNAKESTANQANQREAVKALYDTRSDAPKAAEAEVENARNEVKRLYQETTLEETQRISSEPADGRSAISPEQQRVKEELKLLGAMARDKAEAQTARMEKNRAATRDRIHLNTQRQYQEHFEAYALAREMIAMKDRNLDRQDGQMQAAKAMEQTKRSDIQKDKSKAIQSTAAFQARNRKHEAAVAKRLDIITPGSFEPPKTETNREQPTVRINRNMRQNHQIEVEPNRELAAQDQQQAEQARNESTVRFDETLEDRSITTSPSTESVQEALASLKAKAAQSGLVTLNSQSQAERVAEDVLAETRQRPEQAIQSQSQVSLQAALKVLQ